METGQFDHLCGLNIKSELFPLDFLLAWKQPMLFNGMPPRGLTPICLSASFLFLQLKCFGQESRWTTVKLTHRLVGGQSQPGSKSTFESDPIE